MYQETEIVPVDKALFTYSVLFEALAPGSDVQNINVLKNASFLWIKTTYSCFEDLTTPVTNDTRSIPMVNVAMFNDGSGRNFFDQPVDVQSMAGTDGLPFMVPDDMVVWDSNSTMAVTVTNFSTAITYARLQLTFHGLSLYSAKPDE